jgi:hypothetical protein
MSARSIPLTPATIVAGAAVTLAFVSHGSAAGRRRSARPARPHDPARAVTPAPTRVGRRFRDFNGDGLADVVVVGSPDDAESDGSPITHPAVVVLGSRRPTDVDPGQAKPPAVVPIRSRSSIARAVAARDVDGDGLGDGLTTTENENAIMVVLGRRLRHAIDAQRRGPRTWRIAIPPDEQATYAGRIGDVNGDRIDDFAVTAATGVEPPDATYVVLGTRGRAPAALDTLGAGGFTIR